MGIRKLLSMTMTLVMLCMMIYTGLEGLAALWHGKAKEIIVLWYVAMLCSYITGALFEADAQKP